MRASAGGFCLAPSSLGPGKNCIVQSLSVCVCGKKFFAAKRQSLFCFFSCLLPQTSNLYPVFLSAMAYELLLPSVDSVRDRLFPFATCAFHILGLLSYFGLLSSLSLLGYLRYWVLTKWTKRPIGLPVPIPGLICIVHDRQWR